MPRPLDELEQSVKEVRKGLQQLGTVILALSGVLWAEIIVFRFRGNFADGGFVVLCSAVAIGYSYHLWFLTHLSLQEWRSKADRFFGVGAGWAFLRLDPRFERRSLFLLFFPPASLLVNFINGAFKSPLSAYTSLVVSLILFTEGLVLARLLKKG